MVSLRKLNTKATPELIEKAGFDMVIAALGASPAKPPIPGLNKPHAVVAYDSLLNPDVLGMKAKIDEALTFYGSADRFELIGDCKKPATVQQAMRQAFAVSHSV